MQRLLLALLALGFLVGDAVEGQAQTATFGSEANISLPSGSRPASIALGDFNGDGRIDFATANVGNVAPNPSTPGVSIFLQTANGTFSPAPGSPIKAPGSPRSVAVGDLNKDGKLDLAVASFNSASNVDVSIFPGNGDGTFQSQIVVPVNTSAQVFSVLLGDFDRDGNLDLAVLGFSTTQNQVSILLGHGDGSFKQARNFGTGAGFTGGLHALGDFNNDGNLDVAVPHANNNNVAVLLGDGEGNLSGSTLFAVGGVGPQSVAAADLDKDGILDLVTGDVSSGEISILFGNGDGTFEQPAKKIFVGANSFSVAIGDLNGDGNPDIAVVNGVILLGDGQGNFASGSSFPITVASQGPLAIADLNRDGRSDLMLVKTNPNQISTYLNTTLFALSGAFSPALVVPVGTNPLSVASGDFNRDGKVDLAIVNEGPFPVGNGSVSILLQNPAGEFVAALGSPVAVGLSPRVVAAGDVNGDKILDLAVVNLQSSSVSILMGNGDGTFAPAPSVPLSAFFGSFVALADLDLDGRLDLAVVVSRFDVGPDNAVLIYRGNGDGTFQSPPLTVPSGGQSNCCIALAIGDFNRDGKPDLAINNNNSENVSVVLQDNGGLFGFGAPVFYPTGGFNSLFVVTGDFNGDGKLDLAIPNAGSGNVGILLGNGDGSFQTATTFSSTIAVSSLAVGDLNRDGKQDLAAAVYGNNTVGVLYGNGNGTFQAPKHFDAGVVGASFSPFHLVVDDLNGDGKADIVTANPGGNSASVLLNVAPSADLAISSIDSPDPVTANGELTYVLTVTNKGPAAATGVTVNNALAASLVLFSAIPSQGTCSGNPVITCNLGPMNALATAKITILVRPTLAGGFSNLATVGANETDPNSTDNSVTITTTVLSAVNKPITVVAPQTLAQAQVTVPYLQELPIAPGTPTTATVVRGALPAGLRLEIRATPAPALSPARLVTNKRSARKTTLQLAGGLSTVVVTGTPTTVGTQVFTVLVEDELGRYYQRIKITVCPTVTAATPLTLCDSAMGEGELGVPYRDSIAGAGGSAPYVVEHIGGALPDGLFFTFDRNLQQGIVAGTPTLAARTASFTVRITDAAGTTITNSLTLPIVEPLNVVAKLGMTKMSRTYSARLKSNAGLSPIAWKATNLPPGLIIDEANGVISGRAQARGSYNVTVQATDSLNKIVSVPVTLNVVP